ncbi:MAG: sulfite exporter TauE/SafE family protein [Thermoleophilia bacterium]
MIALAVPIGLALGLALGTVGGGGAVLALPVLVYVLGQSVHAATTASLLVVAGAALAGAIGHARGGRMCWRIAGAFAGAAIPGSLLGTAANAAVPATGLLAGFAVLMLVVAWVTRRRAAQATGAEDAGCPLVRLVPIVGAGLVTGFLTGLLGVGGGFLVVPILALVLHAPLRRAIATSLAIVSAVSLLGLVEHVALGSELDWAVALPFAAAAVGGALAGSGLAARLPQRTLATGFAVVLGSVAIYLLVAVAAFGGPPHG